MDLLAVFDCLPEAEKQPAEDDGAWYSNHEMRDWVRDNVDRRRLAESYEPWFLSAATDPTFLDEARSRFPAGDVVGLIFAHALNGVLRERVAPAPIPEESGQPATHIHCAALETAQAARGVLPAAVFEQLSKRAADENRDLVHNVIPEYLADQHPGEF